MYYYLLTGACLLLTTGSFAQSTSPAVFSSAGTTSQNGALVIDQTIGEPLTQTYTSGTGILTQGFEQPVVSAVGLSEWEDSQVHLYPNPAQHTATVSVPLLTYTQYAVYDATGKRITENTIQNNSFSFSVESYASGVYKLVLQGKIETSLTFIKH